jgi:hypothetical protein
LLPQSSLSATWRRRALIALSTLQLPLSTLQLLFDFTVEENNDE